MCYLTEFVLIANAYLPCSLCKKRQSGRGGHGSGVPESTPEKFCDFSSNPESKNLLKNGPGSCVTSHFRQ